MTDLEAVLQLIKEEPSIETLLGRFKQPNGTDTIFPMVLIGTFPEEQKNLPAISIRGLNKDVQFGVSTSNITISCYSKSVATTTDPVSGKVFQGSQVVASAVNEFFRDSQGGVPGFAARFESSITGNVNDADQSGTIVELKVTYR